MKSQNQGPPPVVVIFDDEQLPNEDANEIQLNEESNAKEVGVNEETNAMWYFILVLVFNCDFHIIKAQIKMTG